MFVKFGLNFLLLDLFKGKNCEEEVACPFEDCATGQFDGRPCNVSVSDNNNKI